MAAIRQIAQFAFLEIRWMPMQEAYRDIVGGLGAGPRIVVTARHLGAGDTKIKEHAMSQKLNSAIAVIGIDIGNSFHIVGHDERGTIVLRQKWSRGQVATRCGRTSASR